MKTKLLLLLLCFLASISFYKLNAQSKAKDPVYVNTISSPDKLIDLIVGVYPLTYEYDRDYDYSTLTLRVLNNSNQAFDWADYRVLIMLTDGTLFSSYKTNSSNGEFANKFTVDSGMAHDQTICFARKFNVDEIQYMWLSWVNEKFFSLTYIGGA
jgi:hypothetical protein